MNGLQSSAMYFFFGVHMCVQRISQIFLGSTQDMVLCFY